jgi:MEDS: MEthanogen/methylotroph, DcmR Sensory domain
MNSHLTNLGIPGIGAVPYGLHVCHFYPSREELLGALIPYFQAGVKNSEKCIWVACEPLPARAVSVEISKHRDLQDALTSGQLYIYDALEWYGDPASMSADVIIARWREKEDQALAEGFRGLRVTGNMSFIPRENWNGLMDYEKKLHIGIQGRHIVACCSYHRLTCEPVDMLEVARNHHAALDLSEDSWQVYQQTP